jgi:hypothetical protein
LLPEARVSIFHHWRREPGCWHHGHALLIHKLTSSYGYAYTFNIKLPCVVNDGLVKSRQYQHNVIYNGRDDHDLYSFIHFANVFAAGAIIIVTRNNQRFERKHGGVANMPVVCL